MTNDMVDLFFSFRGRTDRQIWWLGALIIAAGAVVGTALFNDGSYDESANSIPGSLTMAAFLWLALCIYVFTALCAKRLNDCGRARWLRYTVGLPAAAIVSGWGAGAFLDPLHFSEETLVFWALVSLTVPAIVACAVLPELEEGR
jgi:uncharacterized membrane protein YhaH (DUF805 family)